MIAALPHTSRHQPLRALHPVRRECPLPGRRPGRHGDGMIPPFSRPRRRFASALRAATRRVSLVVLLLPAIGLAPRALVAQSAADRRSAAEVRALFLAFNAAWERRDRAFIDRYYAHDPDAVFFFERRQLQGWPRVDSLYGAMFASSERGRVRSLYDILDVGALGDVAWLAANFRLEVIEPSGDTTADEGRQSVVFERRAGRWVVVHRHTSFQAPPGPQRRVAIHRSPGPLWAPADDTTGGPDAVAIRGLRERSNDAIVRHDTAGIAAVFAPDVVVVTSTSAHVAGRDANARLFAEGFRTHPDVVYRRTPIEVTVHAPWHMASEEGRWTGSWTDPDGKITLSGRYFGKWRVVDGRWRVESETYVLEECRGGAYCRAAPR
jgi:uncharacterized protein (TIGR02246 family)